MIKIFDGSTLKLTNLKTWLVLWFCLLGSVGQALAAQFAYVANGTSNDISVYSIDTDTGILTAGMPPHGILAAAIK